MVIKHFKIAGRELSLNLPDKAAFWVFEEIFENRDYRLLDEILKSAKVVFDVGAHVGLFSIYAGLLNDRVKIYAFEPIEDNFLILKENLKKNGIKNVIAKNLALGSVSGMREIYVNEDSHNHSFYLKSGLLKKVNVTTLPSLLEKLHKVEIEEIDFVKLDCEGSEFEILENMKSEDFVRIRNFYIEFHEYGEGMERGKLQGVLKKHGYKFQTLPSCYDKRMGFILGKR